MSVHSKHTPPAAQKMCLGRCTWAAGERPAHGLQADQCGACNDVAASRQQRSARATLKLRRRKMQIEADASAAGSAGPLSAVSRVEPTLLQRAGRVVECACAATAACGAPLLLLLLRWHTTSWVPTAGDLLATSDVTAPSYDPSNTAAPNTFRNCPSYPYPSLRALTSDDVA